MGEQARMTVLCIGIEIDGRWMKIHRIQSNMENGIPFIAGLPNICYVEGRGQQIVDDGEGLQLVGGQWQRCHATRL